MPAYILTPTKVPHSFSLNGFSCLISGTEGPYNTQHKASKLNSGQGEMLPLFFFVFSQTGKKKGITWEPQDIFFSTH